MKTVYGIGIKDREYPAWRDGRSVKEYVAWCGMLTRCTEKWWHIFPTYQGTTCSENFKHYSFFYEWCQQQIGFGNTDDKGKIWQLDKDILIKGNKVYSEDVCVFVPQRINYLLLKSNNSRGDYPVGVSKSSGCRSFTACCNINGIVKYIGSFKTPEEAFSAYKIFKQKAICDVAIQYKDKIDSRVYDALLNYSVDMSD
ncbi:MAG TPA: hypothetical protein PLW01_02480 [Agitococcus sp.]|nr:hypothetical protein [Agitococcus sp.]